jgi:integrase
MTTYTRQTYIEDDSHNVAYSGDKRLARRVLREYSIDKRWSDETLRARWDGAAALLTWWRDLPPAMRPPLHQLTQDDAQAFVTSLEQRGLARSTIKSYRVGADAMTRALRWAWQIPVGEDPHYRPFEKVQPKPKRRAMPAVDQMKLEALPQGLRRIKLEVLLTLLDLGLSVPEACSQKWGSINLEKRTLWRVRGGKVALGVSALEALEKLWRAQAKYRRDGYYTALGWSPHSARRWLKKVR